MFSLITLSVIILLVKPATCIKLNGKSYMFRRLENRYTLNYNFSNQTVTKTLPTVLTVIHQMMA